MSRCFVLCFVGLLGACTASARVDPSDSGSRDASLDARVSSGSECTTDAECPGGHCVTVTTGGLRVCQLDAPGATTCASGFDQCCASMPCTGAGERCLVSPVVPFCAGVMMLEHNVCAADQCSSDAECGADAICLPAGTLGRKVRACLAAACTADSDCKAASGGSCVPITEGCCNSIAGLFCSYPGDAPCRADGDCSPSAICQIDGDVAHCRAGGRVCPL